jgi:hypothetical protein
MSGSSFPSEPFATLVAAAEHVREHALAVYRCGACATRRGRRSKDEVTRHATRKGELLAALYQAADAAMLAAHRAGVEYDAAERRIGALVGACHEWLTWAWQRRGFGAWHNRHIGEGEDDYLERVAERAFADPCERELAARDEFYRQGRGACLRMAPAIAAAPAAAADAGVLVQTPLTARDIAKRFAVPLEALRKRLERFRGDSDRGWKIAENRTTRSPRYVYLISAVWDIIEDLRRP